MASVPRRSPAPPEPRVLETVVDGRPALVFSDTAAERPAEVVSLRHGCAAIYYRRPGARAARAPRPPEDPATGDGGLVVNGQRLNKAQADAYWTWLHSQRGIA